LPIAQYHHKKQTNQASAPEPFRGKASKSKRKVKTPRREVNAWGPGSIEDAALKGRRYVKTWRASIGSILSNPISRVA
jgi:hypothetical protein